MKYEDDSDNEFSELKPLLSEWRAPDLPAGLDARVRASFRQHVAPRSKWDWLKMPIRVPLPLAAAIGLSLCATSWLAMRRATSLTLETVPMAAVTRFVEVPVVTERVVTRVVYVATPIAAKPKAPVPPKRSTQWRSDLAGFHPVSEITLEVSAGGTKR